MKLNIGENIKKLRRERDLADEDLDPIRGTPEFIKIRKLLEADPN